MGYWILRLITRPFLLVYRTRIEGREHIPEEGPAILAANHRSFSDSWFLPHVVQRRLTFLAKAEYFESWRTAWFFRFAGQIPIRRGGGSASERAIQTAGDELEKGHLVALYPEGTRSLDEAVHRGRTGMARLALTHQVPVIPVGIAGTAAVQPIGARLMRPFKRVSLSFGEPMRLDYPGEDDRSGKDPDLRPSSTAASGESISHDSPSRSSASDDGYLEPHERETVQTPDEHQLLRSFTDSVMKEIARLAQAPYVDEYVASRSAPEEP